MKIAGIANDSIVDGPGLRFTIFTQGCPHNCEGCHNPQTHDFNGGQEININKILEQISANRLLDGVTFSGGEPFYQAHALHLLGIEIKKLGLDIITYTGYNFEYLIEHANEKNGYADLLSVTDYLIDGKFDLGKKNYLLRFKGSSNQRIIDVKKSLTNKAIIETVL